MMQAGECCDERLDGVEAVRAAATRRARVLVVDDDDAVRSAFSLALYGLGCELTMAEDGFKALDYVVHNRVDLVFLDLRMPGIDGVRTLEVLRRLRPSLKVCILSAFVEDHMNDLIDLATESMDFELFRKPLDIDEIRALTITLLDATQSRRRLMIAVTPAMLGRRIAEKRARRLKN